MKAASTAALPPGFCSTFLEGLTPPEIKVVLASGRLEISPHQVLQREGAPATRLWLLLTGRAAAYKLAQEGGKLFLRWGVPGDAFGLATILRKPRPYLVTVEVSRQTFHFVTHKHTSTERDDFEFHGIPEFGMLC